MAYRFDPGEGVQEAILRCSREQMDNAVAELSEGISQDPERAVHSARKTLKKQRSLLRLARGTMSPKQRRRENRALRRAARELSSTRDADVMVQTVAQLSERFVGQLPEKAFTEIAEQLKRARDSQHVARTDSAPDRRAVEKLGVVRVRVEDWQLKQGGWRGLESGLMRSYRRGRTAFAQAQRHSSLENLHAWRKRVKDLWYQERLLAPTCGPATKGQAKDAHRLADVLGDDHDLGLLRHALVGDHLPAEDIDAVVRLIDHRRVELQTEAMNLGQRLYAEKPKAFRRRMQRTWHAGRAIACAPLEQTPAELAQATRGTHAH